jgi:hypothetical protein
MVKIERIALVLAGVMVVGSAVFRDWGIIAGTAAGGAFAFANFRLLRTIVGRALGDPDHPKPVFFALLVPKFAAMAGVLWVIVISERLNLAAFAAGTVSLVAALLAAPFLGRSDAAGPSADTDGLGDSN